MIYELMFNILAIGDPIIDTHVQIEDTSTECHLAESNTLLCLNYGHKIPIVDSFQNLGGNAPNVAIGAARLGLSAAVLSTVGDDAYGRLAMQDLQKQAVDTSLISIDPEHKTRYSMVLNYKGERTILSYSEEKNYAWPEAVPPADWVYYTGLSKGFEVIQEKLLAYLTRHPTARLAVNPGSYLMKYAKERLCEVLPRTDLLIVNLEEAEAILNTTLEAEKGVGGIINKLLGEGAKEVVLTDGPRGAWAGNAEVTYFLKPFPVPIRSKTGAGDAFSSAYIAARFYGGDMRQGLLWGSANSAGVVQAHGPHEGLLDARGIQAILKQYSLIYPTILA